jgi:predicted amidohydrolase YtcJ
MAKMVELDEAEYNRMVALQGVASKIVANPNARKMLEQAHKLVEPNAPTPMLDAEAAHLAPIKETETRLTAEIAALKKEREDEKREATLKAIAERQTAGLAKLRRDGYTDEGVAAVQKLMEDKGLLDVDDAVAIFERANPPQLPANPGGGITGERWNFADTNADSDKDIAALISGKGDGSAADAAAMRMANQALQELRGSRR